MKVVEHEGKPTKILVYFPLIPRLKRIYMSFKIAADMIWHDKERQTHGILRHPAYCWHGRILIACIRIFLLILLTLGLV